MEIDLHRQKSCLQVKSPQPRGQRIYWTPLDPNERPKTIIIRPIDGVKFNYLMAKSDPVNNRYSCFRNDMKFHDITFQEFEACMALLDNVCENVFPNLCKFDVTTMEKVKESASNGELMLDQRNSCKPPQAEEEYLGIYNREAETVAALSFDQTSYIYNSGPLDITHEEEGLHCKNLIDATCSAWDLTWEEEPYCTDDPNFILHGSPVQKVEDLISGNTNVKKNCDWIAKNKRMCTIKSRDTGKRAFEACRKSCGYCSCADNKKYLFNGQPEKDCNWIKEDSTTRCTLDGAENNCRATCNITEKCCEDDPKFYYNKEPKRDCKWAAMNKIRKSARCGKRPVAAKCPMACDLCPSP